MVLELFSRGYLELLLGNGARLLLLESFRFGRNYRFTYFGFWFGFCCQWIFLRRWFGYDGRVDICGGIAETGVVHLHVLDGEHSVCEACSFADRSFSFLHEISKNYHGILLGQILTMNT